VIPPIVYEAIRFLTDFLKINCFFPKGHPATKDVFLTLIPRAQCVRVEFFSYYSDGHLILGQASGLEAFNQEPPRGSIGALAFRQTPETRGVAREFLSYYP